jgi:hypothetical protein
MHDPFGGLVEKGNAQPLVHTILTGGMPGWQITLIAAAAAIAVILDPPGSPAAPAAPSA